MRPSPIVWFERVVLLCLALNAFQVYQRLFGQTVASSGLILLRTPSLTAYAAIVAVTLILIWLIGRRRISLAKWLYIALCVARVALSIVVPIAVRHVSPTFPLIACMQLILMAVSIWLLFRPDARHWFAGVQPVDPETSR
jgi:hypothetical protein